MNSETHLEQPVHSDEEVIQEDAVAPPTARGLPYKTVLVAVVVGIIIVSGLWLFVIGQEESPSNGVTEWESGIQPHGASETIGTRVARTEDKYDQIDQRLASLSDRIERGFEAQQGHSRDVQDSLAAMGESVRAVKVTVTELAGSNRELGQRVGEAISRLDIVKKDVHQHRIAQRKPTAKSKPRPAKKPPFRIDAIDVWDEETFVAVSQAGRVAFLKAGGQQAGWTVTHIDRLEGRIDFRGPAGQGHSITLQR